jgi:hypothetical protein
VDERTDTRVRHAADLVAPLDRHDIGEQLPRRGLRGGPDQLVRANAITRRAAQSASSGRYTEEQRPEGTRGLRPRTRTRRLRTANLWMFVAIDIESISMSGIIRP